MPMTKLFLVVDTNAFISAQLIEGSTSARAYDKALTMGKIAVSENVLSEYFEVLHRPKLDKYLSAERREVIIEKLLSVAILLKPIERITACRDPKDNKFLELALTANAAALISGDPHLLELHPFRDIPIINASDFLKNY